MLYAPLVFFMAHAGPSSASERLLLDGTHVPPAYATVAITADLQARIGLTLIGTEYPMGCRYSGQACQLIYQGPHARQAVEWVHDAGFTAAQKRVTDQDLRHLAQTGVDFVADLQSVKPSRWTYWVVGEPAYLVVFQNGSTKCSLGSVAHHYACCDHVNQNKIWPLDEPKRLSAKDSQIKCNAQGLVSCSQTEQMTFESIPKGYSQADAWTMDECVVTANGAENGAEKGADVVAQNGAENGTENGAEEPTWTVSKGECDVTCGEGNRPIAVTCSTGNDADCSGIVKPSTIEVCSLAACLECPASTDHNLNLRATVATLAGTPVAASDTCAVNWTLVHGEQVQCVNKSGSAVWEAKSGTALNALCKQQ